MRPRIQPGEWYSGAPDQYQWASGYWTLRAPKAMRKGAPIYPGEQLASCRDQALEQMSRICTHPEGLAFLTRMRKAWGKQTSLALSDKRTHSYSITKTAGAELAQIAKWTKRSKSATLEDLIRRGYAFEEAERAYRREALAKVLAPT